MDAEQEEEFKRLMATERYEKVYAFENTLTARSLEQGRQEGRRDQLRELLEDRFGPLSPTVLERLQQLTGEGLLALGKRLLHAQSLKELGLED